MSLAGILPPFLEKGSCIAVWEPAFADSARQLHVAQLQALLHQAGYELIIDTASYSTYYRFAGDTAERLALLERWLCHEHIKAIWALRGGYGSYQLLNDMPFSLWRCSPKWLIGFSDLTALHLALYHKSHIAALHAPMAGSLMHTQPICLEQTLRILKGSLPTYRLPAHPAQQPGSARAVLLGGNLSVLVSLLGTPFMPSLQGCILFLEEVGEHLYKIDRLLHQLHYACSLKALSGLIIGSMSQSPDGESQDEIYDYIAHRIKAWAPQLPVYFGFPAGHEQWNMPLLQGVIHELSITEEGFYLAAHP